MSGSTHLLLCSCPDEATATKLARGLVNQHLAACVNVLPGATSIYQWQNQLCEETECLLLIKSVSTRIDDIKTYVQQHHPYELPELIAVPISAGLTNYLQWIEDACA